MQKVPIQIGTRVDYDFRPEVPYSKRPQILGEFYKFGKRMYQGLVGKEYDADMFDNYFKPKFTGKVLRKHHKGSNPNSQTEFLYS